MFYQCPDCQSELTDLKGEALSCSKCSEAYPIVNKAPNFTKNAKLYIHDRTHEDLLSVLVKKANDLGWRQALETTFLDRQGTVEYNTSARRTSFLGLLPINDQSTVLDYGCGLGAVTGRLAQVAGFVCAIDRHPLQAQFVRCRADQEGFANVDVAAGGNLCSLPYKRSSFDLAILSAVIEWCWIDGAFQSPEDGQIKLLEEIFRVLKPGGLIYLATKNKYALRYLMGSPDEHSNNMKFSFLFPWMIRNWLSQRLYAKRVPGCLYSYGGYKRLLRQSGFTDIRFYAEYPSYRAPECIIPLEGPFAKRTLIYSNLKMRTKILGLVPDYIRKRIVYSYGIIAKKQ